MGDSDKWLRRIERAQSEQDLVAIIREYVGTWLPSDLDRLPSECRMPFVSTGSEISVAAVTLTQLELRGNPVHESASLLRDMADVMVAAQMRLRQILGRRHDPTATDKP